jgi:hypothetical protein
MSSIVIAGDTSGSVTLQAPAVAGTVTLTLPATSGTVALTSAASQWTTTGANIYYTTGSVGIGTTTPSAKLDVGGFSTTNLTTVALAITDAPSAANSGLQIAFRNPSTTYTYASVGYSNEAGGSSGALLFYTNPNIFTNTNVEKMRLTSAGNLGIGDTNPTNAKLVVTGGGIVTSIMTSTVARFSGSANSILMGDDGTDGVIGVGNSSSNLGFLSRVAGVYTKTMVLTSAGYLLLGYTTSNGSYNLQVNSQIFATSATIATSDGRYKENVIPLSGALSLVNALNPVQFEWKNHPVHNFDRQQPTVGFIAQEVQQVLVDKPYLNSIIKRNECTIPEEKDADGNVTKEAYVEEFLGIAEGNMIAILTKAIQEQQALITQLTERITALEAN